MTSPGVLKSLLITISPAFLFFNVNFSSFTKSVTNRTSGFQGMQAPMNLAMFGAANTPNSQGDWQNPHGTKRARGE